MDLKAILNNAIAELNEDIDSSLVDVPTTPLNINTVTDAASRTGRRIVDGSGNDLALLQRMGQSVVDSGKGVLDSVTGAAKPVVAKAWDNIYQAGQNAIEKSTPVVAKAWGDISQAGQNAVEQLKQTGQNVANQIKQNSTNPKLSSDVDVPEAPVDIRAVSDALSKFGQDVYNTGEKAYNYITSPEAQEALKNAYNTAADAANYVGGKISSGATAIGNGLSAAGTSLYNYATSPEAKQMTQNMLDAGANAANYVGDQVAKGARGLYSLLTPEERSAAAPTVEDQRANEEYLKRQNQYLYDLTKKALTQGEGNSQSFTDDDLAKARQNYDNTLAALKATAKDVEDSKRTAFLNRERQKSDKAARDAENQSFTNYIKGLYDKGRKTYEEHPILTTLVPGSILAGAGAVALRRRQMAANKK